MAIAEVSAQRATSGSNDGVDSDALAYPNNVSTGDLLIVGGCAWISGGAPTSIAVTDTRSTAYTVVLGAVPAGTVWRTFIAYGIASSGGACTVTVNPSGASGSFSFSIGAFTGADAAPSDVDGGTTTGTSSTTPSDNILTVAADALIIGVFSHDGGTITITPGTNYTMINENETNSANQCHHLEFRIVTTATTYAVGATLGSPNTYAAQSHSFKPSTGGAAFIAATPHIIQQAVNRLNTY